MEVASVQQLVPEHVTQTPLVFLKLVALVAAQELPFQQFAPEQVTQTPLEFLKLVVFVATQEFPFQQLEPEQLTHTPLEFLKLVVLVAAQVLPFQVYPDGQEQVFQAQEELHVCVPFPPQACVAPEAQAPPPLHAFHVPVVQV